MVAGVSIRLALVVTRDLAPGSAWGYLVTHLLGRGHLVVASKQPIDVFRFPIEESPLEIFPRDITSDDYLKIPIEPGAQQKLNSFVNRSEYASVHAVL